jgi:nucleotide-binding universal stress UspA family protein
VIVSASYRTDIPAFYGAWFLDRLRAGACRVPSPYGGPDYDVVLTPPVADGFVFWTRNAKPFLPVFEETAARGFPFVAQYTITGYPRALEPSVVPAEAAVALVKQLARRHGRRAVVWRYDPVFLTSLTPPDWHRRRFAELASSLRGASDEVVLSFAQIYAKTKVNSDRAARRYGFTWSDPDAAVKAALLGELAAIAREQGLRPTLCSQPELVTEAIEPAACIDAARLSDLAGRPITARIRGNRPGCLCAESRDIGAYDTCPHGCIYCYAVRRPAVAKARYRAHDPASTTL